MNLPEADKIEGEAVPRIEAQRPCADHQAFDKTVGRAEEAAIGFEHSDGIGLRPQRALQCRAGLRFGRARVVRAVPDHLDAAQLKRRQRDGGIDIVGLGGDLLLAAWSARRANRSLPGLTDRGNRLFDRDLAAGLRFRFCRDALLFEQLVDAHRQRMANVRHEARLLELFIHIVDVDRKSRRYHAGPRA